MYSTTTCCISGNKSHHYIISFVSKQLWHQHFCTNLPNYLGENSFSMPYHQVLPHGTHLNQCFFGHSSTPYPFPPYGGQLESFSHKHSTMQLPLYLIPYPGIWPKYQFGYPPHGLLPYGMPPIHPSMPTFSPSTPPTLPPVLPTPQALSTSVIIVSPIVFVTTLATLMLSQDPISPLVVVDEKQEELKAMIKALQLSVMKHIEIVEIMKCLCPLAKSIYNEVLPTKYKRPVFNKFYGDDNPQDHITIFELECGIIVSKDKLKLQQFASSFTGKVLCWSNNRLYNSIAMQEGW